MDFAAIKQSVATAESAVQEVHANLANDLAAHADDAATAAGRLAKAEAKSLLSKPVPLWAVPAAMVLGGPIGFVVKFFL